MIVFDLRCGDGHVFEAWFGTAGDFETQSARGLVSCPICGAGDIAKAITAPAIASKSNRSEPTASDIKAMLGSLATAQRKALEGSEHVGANFAQEARAIHLGEAEARAIHGQATRGDARALIEEGIAVAPLPLPIVAPKEEN